ncbi:MAG TPA: hypothetical protein VNL13_02225 [Sulfolobales archaeon]|nr:hypothetical protein [Sulfolobales archaeon]
MGWGRSEKAEIKEVKVSAVGIKIPTAMKQNPMRMRYCSFLLFTAENVISKATV